MSTPAKRTRSTKPRPARRPADENRRRRLEIIAELDRLMTRQLDPEFHGNVSVSVPAKDGRIGTPKFTQEQFGAFSPDA